MANTGNSARLERLLDGESYRRAWRYCLSLCGERMAAEDLLQDALARALLKLGALRDEASFLPWLLRIARCRFLDQRRRRRAPLPLGESLALPAAQALPVSDLELALEAMAPALREVVELVYLHELSLAEAGRVMGISASAAKQKLYRARMRLRQLLALEGPPVAAGKGLRTTEGESDV